MVRTCLCYADEPIESWRCFDYFGEKQMLLELACYRGAVGEYGVIHLPGVEPITTFCRFPGNRLFALIDLR